jgi:hypothetical protein
VRAIGAFSKAGSFGRFHSTSTGRKPKLRATGLFLDQRASDAHVPVHENAEEFSMMRL